MSEQEERERREDDAAIEIMVRPPIYPDWEKQMRAVDRIFARFPIIVAERDALRAKVKVLEAGRADPEISLDKTLP